MAQVFNSVTILYITYTLHLYLRVLAVISLPACNIKCDIQCV